MGGEPCATIREHTPESSIHRTGDAPDVRVVVSHPSTATIHLTCRLGTRLAQILDQGEQRLGILAQIGYLSWPIIHLGIDVDGILAVPRRILAVVPYTLQIGCLTSRL